MPTTPDEVERGSLAGPAPCTAVNWERLDVEPGSALLVVDAQHGFRTADTRHGADELERLLAARAPDFSLIIATQFVNAPDSLFRSLIGWDELTGPPETDLLPAVAGVDPVVITKNGYGAGQQIGTLLAEHHISTVYVCGIDTDVCVLHNAAQLFDAGFTVIALTDACASTGGESAHTAAVAVLRRTIGDQQVLGR